MSSGMFASLVKKGQHSCATEIVIGSGDQKQKPGGESIGSAERKGAEAPARRNVPQ